MYASIDALRPPVSSKPANERQRGERRRELISRFIRLQAMGGAFSFVAAVCAILIANGRFAPAYFDMLDTVVGPISARRWVNDILMPTFFFVLAMRLKREWYLGALSTSGDRRFALIAAISGSALPAAVLVYFAETGYHWLGLLVSSWAAGLAWSRPLRPLVEAGQAFREHCSLN